MKRPYFSMPNLQLLPLAFMLLMLLASGCGMNVAKYPPELEEQFRLLDTELRKVDGYDAVKNQRMARLKQELASASRNDDKIRIADNLIGEYESYISDSALCYINANIRFAQKAGDEVKVQKLKLQRIDVMSHAGLFGDALNEMQKLDRGSLDPTLLEEYYYVNCGLYQYLIEYNNENDLVDTYKHLQRIYIDSLLSVSDAGSFICVTYRANSYISDGNTDAAQDMIKAKLKQYQPGSHEYSILSSILAYSYDKEHDDINHKKYLILSAVSDIKGSTKENMAFRALSQQLFDDGYIDRAKYYLQKSFDDANFYAARMRTAQSARMLPVIDSAYDARQLELQTRLKWLLTLAVALVVVLSIAILFILQQMRKLHQAHSTIKSRNDELSQISSQLSKSNDELAATIGSLRQSDSIKEQYAGLFMQFSSLTIRNLENYHQKLHNLAVKGNVKELVKKIEGENVADQILKDFYKKFDDAILNIYPDFVEHVNALLQPDQQLIPKPGNKLNTELRVLALIRIGVTDSEKIAEFLRCSLTTIYTYRSKIRKRALNPDSFEDDLLL